MKKLNILLFVLAVLMLVVTLPATALATSDGTPASVVTNWVEILAIVEAIAVAIVGFMVKYFKTSAKFRGFVTQLIADAEVKYAKAEKAGSIKMDYVIDRIYEFIPTPLRILFARSSLKEFVQGVFDQIAKYATIQCDKAVTALQARYNASKKK